METDEPISLAARQLAMAWMEARRAKRAARAWKALAKALWGSAVVAKGGRGRYGCAAIDVRMRRNGLNE